PPPDAATLADARRALAAADPALARLDRELAAFDWRSRPGGFTGLLRMIVGQQVSVVSADATWSRLEVACGGEVTPGRVAALSVDEMRACGFSGQKARYAHAMAEAVSGGRIDFAALSALPEAQALAALEALLGVGRWTAEVYLMMAEARLDAFPAGDIAVQEAMRWLDRGAARPSPAEAYARAERWRPHRAVAAHMLWAWYLQVKAGEAPHPLGEATRASQVAGVGA
ncbi:MAG: DNA-3-methyladenine glycosylase 2 family protein, partial [Caulobacteraceae bacterium]|nr:DNA-3-methyladenine glycosylase 2 family protein [Caulobacter sp.]